jgi:hypothetical protein
MWTNAAAKQSEFDFSGVIRPANDTTPYHLSYAELVVPLVKAVQEQQSEIDRLKSALAAQPTSLGTPPWLLLVACALASALGGALVLLAQYRPRRGPTVASAPLTSPLTAER